MDPVKPEVLYAATYDKERKPWTFNLGGMGSAIYKTIDAGKTWTKLTGGLPGGPLGRIGLDIYPKNPLDPLRQHRERQQAQRVGRGPREGDCARASRATGRSAKRSTGPTTAARPGRR